MNSKVISGIIVFSFLIVSQVFAECGSDHSADEPKVKKSKVNTLVTSVTNDGNINGLVITSCGQCKLGFKGEAGCTLTIKIGESIYSVKGTGIHDHGDAHGSEGFCSAIRVAWATGQIKKDVFHAESFDLVGGPE